MIRSYLKGLSKIVDTASLQLEAMDTDLENKLNHLVAPNGTEAPKRRRHRRHHQVKLSRDTNIEELNQVRAVLKERLREVTWMFIQRLRYETSGCDEIGVKKSGELDIEPFRKAMKRKFSGEEAEHKAVELWLVMHDQLRDPEWRPFKIIADQEGHCIEIPDEENETLTFLKKEYGEEVYNAMTIALTELWKERLKEVALKMLMWYLKDAEPEERKWEIREKEVKNKRKSVE